MAQERTLLGLLTSSLVVIGLLSWRVYTDKQAIERLGTKAQQRTATRLERGVSVPDLAGSTLNDTTPRVHFQDQPFPVVLYVFTAGCKWCTRNLDGFRALRDQLRGRYAIYGVALSRFNLDEYLNVHAMNVPIITNLSDETITAFGFRSTPETIVVSREGRVLEVWAGVYTGLVKDDIEATLHVRLPSLERAE